MTDNSCPTCGTEQHPRRADYNEEVSWLLACLEHLDRLHPSRVERMREWRRVALSEDRVAIRARIVELITVDGPLTRDEERELAALTDRWKALRNQKTTEGVTQ